MSIKKLTFILIITIALTLGLSISLQSLLAAWTAPTAIPPNDNTAAPINVSATGQAKQGGLILNTSASANGLIVQYGNVGIGTVSPGAKLDVNGDIYSTIMYDRDNTGYYINPAGTSKFNIINLGGESRSSWPSGAVHQTGLYEATSPGCGQVGMVSTRSTCTTVICGQDNYGSQCYYACGGTCPINAWHALTHLLAIL